MMSGPDSSPITATNLSRYSVTPTDVQTVRQQLNAADKCDDQMIRQFVQATGGDLTTVSVCFLADIACSMFGQSADGVRAFFS